MTDTLARARKELDAARRALARMREARSIQQFEEAWQDLLGRLEKCWNKTKRSFAQGAYGPWRGAHDHRRSTDPLLRYLKLARDGEEHTVIDTLETREEGIAIGPARGKELHIGSMKIDKGVITVTNSTPDVAVRKVPARARLAAAVSRGVIELPPTEHLGQKVVRSDPVSIAELAIKYYQDLLDDAEQRFGPQGSET